jgi:hypothetical protein
VRSFVATLGASLEEFAGNIKAILNAKLKTCKKKPSKYV